MTAYSVLGSRGAFWGTHKIMESDVLKEIAEAKGKTVAQVLSKDNLKIIDENTLNFLLRFTKTGDLFFKLFGEYRSPVYIVHLPTYLNGLSIVYRKCFIYF